MLCIVFGSLDDVFCIPFNNSYKVAMVAVEGKVSLSLPVDQYCHRRFDVIF